MNNNPMLKPQIARQGFAVMPTAATPEFSATMYTVGLTAKGWPEIIVTGNLPELVKANMIMGLVHIWREQGAAMVMTWENFITSTEASAKVERVSAYAGGECRVPLVATMYEHYSLVQIIWPAPEVWVLPTHKSYPHDKFRQDVLPLLD